jgi:hypothetical protein
VTSSASRRKKQRQHAQAQLAERRDRHDPESADVLTDDVFGWELRPLRGHSGRARLRWIMDRDSYLALVSLQALRTRVLDGLEIALVEECRADGASWEDIGFALDVSGERARQKHGKRRPI